MTLVHIDLRLPDEVTPAVGAVYFAPTRRLDIGGYTVLPTPFVVQLVDGKASVDLRPTEVSWAWHAQEKIVGGKRHALAVPDVTSINYNDLTEVDPATLSPVAVPEAAWWAALDDIILGGGGTDGAALVAHINSAEPHPVYDDLPDLSLQFENGLI